MKVALSEIKKNPLEPTVERMKLRIKSMSWIISRKEKAFNLNSRKKDKFKKMRNLWDIFKCTNIWTMGMPEGEEKEQEIENIFEKMMKEKP